MTRAAGASVTFTVNVRRLDKSNRFGLVMAEGPTRGRARISIDGHAFATINTHALVATNRVLVFARALTLDRHVITVTNLATPHHPRIDIDAFIL